MGRTCWVRLAQASLSHDNASKHSFPSFATFCTRSGCEACLTIDACTTGPLDAGIVGIAKATKSGARYIKTIVEPRPSRSLPFPVPRKVCLTCAVHSCRQKHAVTGDMLRSFGTSHQRAWGSRQPPLQGIPEPVWKSSQIHCVPAACN